MFSRRLLQSSLRAETKAQSLLLLNPTPPPPRLCASFTPRQFTARFNTKPPSLQPRPRIIHYRYDPEHARNAKPLLRIEQISSAIRSRQTKWIAILSSGAAVIFYFSNQETVPVSGRRRFNCYSEESVEAEGEVMYQKIMADAEDALLPAWDPRTKMVERVMRRLISGSGLENVSWEVHVIQSPDKNAFVIPGGKVFVFSGILPIAKDDAGLAAILGHEIAHNVAQHAAEKMSSVVMIQPIRWALIFLDMSGFTAGLGRILGDFALELGIARPASRKQESEADYIGLMMMAKSCYDPRAAVGVWERMEASQADQIPEWISTHPSNANRIERMREWLPKAEEARDEAGCSVTLSYAKEFQGALAGLGFKR